MRENKKTGILKDSCQKFITSKVFFVQVLTEAYILLRTREITKMYEVPKLHRG